MIPGEIETVDGDIELNAGLPRTTVTVANTGLVTRWLSYGAHVAVEL